MSLSFPVPKVALGTAPIGSMAAQFGFAVSDEDTRNTILHSFQNGIPFIDTAPLYGNGLSEIRIGNVIGELPRKELIIATKCGWLPNTVGGPVTDGTRIYTKDAVKKSVEDSLKRLKTDYLDIVHVHDPDLGDFRRQVLDEAFPTLNDLKSQGVIRAVGSGMNEWQMLADWARNADVDCFLLAGRYSLLEQEPLREFFPLVESKNISIFLGGVFNSGILATGAIPGARYNYAVAPESIMAKTKAIEAVCARYDVPLRAAALQFAAAPTAVTTLALGMVTPAQVDDNLAMLAHPIPADLWKELLAEKLIDSESPLP
ncbi:oxidoreductase [Bryobacterales bacterium F-183]|nr:oxidoreductase [Bryobacterales bacterium F-183]